MTLLLVRDIVKFQFRPPTGFVNMSELKTDGTFELGRRWDKSSFFFALKNPDANQGFIFNVAALYMNISPMPVPTKSRMYSNVCW